MKTQDMQTLEEFLNQYDPGHYDRPSVTVDTVVFTFDGHIRLLLIQRRNHPYIHTYALPGGFIEMGEALNESAQRELQEETGLSGIPLYPIGAFGEPTRDPRTRVITTAFAALAPQGSLHPQAADDAQDAQLFDLRCTAGDAVRINARPAGALIHLPCSADGRLDIIGRRLDLSLSHGDLIFNSTLVLCRDALVCWPVLLQSDIAGDHALIIVHALLWLCSLDAQKAAQTLCPAQEIAPVLSALRSIRTALSN